MDYTACNDAKLIRYCREGDRNAFVALYDRHHGAVTNFAWNMLRDYDAALDVCQETFQYIFRKLNDYEESGRFRALLFTAARSLCLSERHKRKKLHYTNLDELSHADESPGPEDVSQRREWNERVSEAVLALPGHYREVLLLRFKHECSYEDIAGVVGCPEGTVKSRIHNGLQKLQAALGAQWNADGSQEM